MGTIQYVNMAAFSGSQEKLLTPISLLKGLGSTLDQGVTDGFLTSGILFNSNDSEI
jgi:hypothetical protein